MVANPIARAIVALNSVGQPTRILCWGEPETDFIYGGNDVRKEDQIFCDLVPIDVRWDCVGCSTRNLSPDTGCRSCGRLRG